MYSDTSNNQFIMDFSKKIGLVTYCLMSCHSSLSLPIKYILEELNQPITQEKIVFIFNADGEIKGFITWANVSVKTLEKMKSIDNYQLHKFEWSDGDIIVLNNIFLIEKINKSDILNILRSRFNSTEVKWFNKKKNKSIDLARYL